MTEGPYRRTWREWWRLHWWRVLFGAALTIAVAATVVTLAVVTQGAIFPIIGAWVAANATPIGVGVSICGFFAGVATLLRGCCGRRSEKVAAEPASNPPRSPARQAVRGRAASTPAPVVTPAGGPLEQRRIRFEGADADTPEPAAAAAAAAATPGMPPVMTMRQLYGGRTPPAGPQIIAANATRWGPTPEKILPFNMNNTVKLVMYGERCVDRINAVVENTKELFGTYSLKGTKARWRVYEAIFRKLEREAFTKRVFTDCWYDGIDENLGRAYMKALQRRVHILSAMAVVLEGHEGWETFAHVFHPGGDDSMALFQGGIREAVARAVKRYLRPPTPAICLDTPGGSRRRGYADDVLSMARDSAGLPDGASLQSVASVLEQITPVKDPNDPCHVSESATNAAAGVAASPVEGCSPQ